MITAVQNHRALGVLVGQACGDALGVPYEFGTPPRDREPEMLGGGLGNYRPGEWSDDTQMALCIAEVAATGADLTTDAALDGIAERFEEWNAGGPADIGIQTRAVLNLAGQLPGSPAARVRQAAHRIHQQSGRSAGNGALMRTAPVALAHIFEPDKAVEAARAIAALTHFDPLAGDSAVLWTDLIRRAVLEGESTDLDLDLGLLPQVRRDYWANLIGEAVAGPPTRFTQNASTMGALQAAYSSLLSVDRGLDGEAFFHDAVVQAVRVGHDTDTVAAICGAAAGALVGIEAIPSQWRADLNGWPGYRVEDLVRISGEIVGGRM